MYDICLCRTSVSVRRTLSRSVHVAVNGMILFFFMADLPFMYYAPHSVRCWKQCRQRVVWSSLSLPSEMSAAQGFLSPRASWLPPSGVPDVAPAPTVTIVPQRGNNKAAEDSCTCKVMSVCVLCICTLWRRKEISIGHKSSRCLNRSGDSLKRSARQSKQNWPFSFLWKIRKKIMRIKG